MTTENPKHELLKTTNMHKTKPSETKAWFRSPFMPSGQEMDQVYSTVPGVRMGCPDSTLGHSSFIQVLRSRCYTMD